MHRFVYDAAVNKSRAIAGRTAPYADIAVNFDTPYRNSQRPFKCRKLHDRDA